MTDTDTLVADNGAELALLAGLLAYPDTREPTARLVAPSDYANPHHTDLAAVIADLDAYDPQAVLTACQRRGLPHAAALLPRLIGRETVPDHVLLHAQTVRDCARRRGFIETCTRAVQQASNPVLELGHVVIDVLAHAEQLVDTALVDDAPPQGIADFLAVRRPVPWLVQGLLAKGDRVIVTGAEGLGKSEIGRQVAVAVAAGIHPWTLAEIPARSVLLVDLENPDYLLQDRLELLCSLARRRGRPVANEALRVEHRPAGIDLGDPADAAWLTRKIELARPDLVVTGPLYRMHTADLSKEEPAREITVVLDRACHRVGAALLLEAHAGHGDRGVRWWRPKGSSLFMAWAQFGLGLRSCKDGGAVLEQWRGPRAARDWPERLRRGGDGGWPWVESEPW